MRVPVLLAGLLGLAAAAPSPSGPVKRAVCATQPAGPGPVPTPDTASAFLNGPQPTNVAQSSYTVYGYDSAYNGQKCAANGRDYRGYTTLSSFDPAACGAICNKDASCNAFNIYIERGPTQEPDASQCPNPPSNTYYRCSFWGQALDSTQCTNTGQFRANFQVAIVGSYAFNKLDTTEGFTGCWSTSARGNATALAGTCSSYGSGGVLEFGLDGPASPATQISVRQNVFADNWLFQYFWSANNAFAQSCTTYFNGVERVNSPGQIQGGTRFYYSAQQMNWTITCAQPVQAGTFRLYDMQMADTRHGYNVMRYP